MSDIEVRGGSLEHLSEAGLKSLIRDLQSRIWDAESTCDQLREEVKKLQSELTSCGNYAHDQYEAYDRTVAHWKSVAGKLKEALEVCERLDRTPIYEYGQPDRQGNKPGIGQRWMTPKEKSKEALAQYNASRGDEKLIGGIKVEDGVDWPKVDEGEEGK